MQMVNYIAVLVASVAAYILGALWYSPVLFGKQWMKLMKLTPKDLEKAKVKGMGKSYFLGFIGAFVMAWVVAYFVGLLGITNALAGLVLGFWLWLGFVAVTTLDGVLWAGMPWTLWILNNSHSLVRLFIMGAILGSW
jgi:hypothetical protein